MRERLNNLIIDKAAYNNGLNLTIDDATKIAVEYAKMAVELCAEYVEGDIVFPNLKAEKEFEEIMSRFEEGVDYEIGLSRQSILDVKSLL